MPPQFSVPTLILLLLTITWKTHAALRTYNFTIHNATRSPDGFPRQIYLVNDQAPGPLIEVNEGDELEVFVKNDLVVETTIHWHGILQRGTPQMDGTPGVTQKPIQPGGNFTYRFSLEGEYGFYWYHSHFRAYSDDAIRGPLVIHPSPDRPKPYKSLATDESVLADLQDAERSAVPLLLSDWYHRVSDDIFNEYIITGAFPNCVDSLLANGQGRVQCLPEYILDAGTDLGMDTGNATTTSATTTTSMTQGMTMSTTSMGTEISMPKETTMMEGMSMDPMSRRGMEGMSMGDMSMSMHATTTSAAAEMSMSSMTMESSGMSMGTSSMTGMAGMPGMASSSLSPRGCLAPMMFNPGYNASSLPTETCTNTTAPLLTVDANYTRGWLALDLVNGGSTTKLSVSLDSHSFQIYAADGYYVKPQEVQVLQISNGQRYSVMVKLDQMPGNYTLRFASFPYGSDMQQVIEGQAIVMYQGDNNMDTPMDMTNHGLEPWMLINGSATTNSTQLDEKSLHPAEVITPPSQSSITYDFSISQTEVTTWTINGTPFQEPEVPILYGNISEGWTANTTLHVPLNSTVDIILRVANDSMDTMGHPVHLHGNRFWVLGSGTDSSFPFQNVANAASSSLLNLDNPPYRDTTDLPASGWTALRFVADNPGAWMFHCHMQWHLVSGMAMVFLVGEQEIPRILDDAGATTGNGTQTNSTGNARSNGAEMKQVQIAGIAVSVLVAIMTMVISLL